MLAEYLVAGELVPCAEENHPIFVGTARQGSHLLRHTYAAAPNGRMSSGYTCSCGWTVREAGHDPQADPADTEGIHRSLIDSMALACADAVPHTPIARTIALYIN